MSENDLIMTNGDKWAYQASVSKAKELLVGVRRKTLELVRELYAAHEALSAQGKRTDNPSEMFLSIETTSGQMARGSAQTWAQYCEDVGIPLTTAKRWLKLYIPEEDRLLTMDELREQIESRYQEGLKQILAHVGEPDWRPSDWPLAFESRYKAYVIEEERQRKLLQQNFNALPANPQLSLFDEPYLMRLGERVCRYNTDIVEYQDFCMRVKSEACPKVPIQKQVNVYKLVKAALEDFEPTVRPDVARFVAELTVRDSAGEFDDNGRKK